MALPTIREYDPRLSSHYQAFTWALDEALKLAAEAVYLDAVIQHIGREISEIVADAYERLNAEFETGIVSVGALKQHWMEEAN